MTTTEQQVFHFAQVSGEAFDDADKVAEDCNDTFETEPDAAGFTEFSNKGHRDVLLSAAKRNGYLVRGGVGDTAIALRGDHGFRRFQSVIAHGGGRDAFGAYGSRPLEVLTAEMYGETTTVLEGHWVRPKNLDRRKKHAIMTDLAIQLMTEHSAGTKLSVLLGDLNEDDNPTERLGSAGARFNKAGITTVWDELGIYPATGPGGGTIDIAATKDTDKRMRALGVNVWRRGHSDHNRVSFFIGVRGLA